MTMTNEERLTALEKRMDVFEAFHVRLWMGPISTSIISCGTAMELSAMACSSPLHGYSMIHNITMHKDDFPFLEGQK